MASLDELLLKPPPEGAGIPIRRSTQAGMWDDMNWDEGFWDAPDGLRFVVEMAVPAPDGAARWGVVRWGQGRWSLPDWRDLTCRFQGAEWTRGGAPGSDDDPGEITLQFDNTDGRLLPWSPKPFTSPAYMGAGTLMRVSVISEGADPLWWPQIVAISSAWQETPVAGGQASWISVPGLETISQLASVRQFAVTPEGAGDTTSQRFLRLLAAAEWLYGSDPAPISATYTYQATDLSVERLEELRALARSWDARFRSDALGRATMARTGDAIVDHADRLVVLSHRCGLIDDELHVPYVADSLEYANDDEMAVTVVKVTNEGGYETTIETGNAQARARFGWVDTDVELNVQTGIQAAVGADLADRILARAEHTIRPVACALDSEHGSDVVDLIIGLDVDRRVTVDRPGVRFSNARVCEVAHAVQARGAGEGVRWTVEVGFDVTVDYEWEAVA